MRDSRRAWRDFPSPQPLLWPADAVKWHLIRRAPAYTPRRKQIGRAEQARQLTLFAEFAR